MVSISNLSSIDVNKTAAGMSLADSNLRKAPSFGKKREFRENAEDYKHDKILSDNPLMKFKVTVEKTANIPLVHYPRGLGGAPDYTFFEYLQTAKLPYWVGGPILAALFYSGIKKDNFQSAAAAKKVAKHMALGVGLYYVGAMAAKYLINKTVKFSRGIDLDQPYRKVIPTSTNSTGVFQKDVEYHKVFESIDFTRWDLLYQNGKDNQEINKKYNKLAKKYNLKDSSPNDADSTLKPLIKKTIVMARAWQYALTAFFVSMGIGMANQSAWDFRPVSWKQVKDGALGKNLGIKERIKNVAEFAVKNIFKPLGASFMQFWHGQSKASSIAGKASIISTGLALVLANYFIITKTSAKNHQTERTSDNKHKGIKKH